MNTLLNTKYIALFILVCFSGQKCKVFYLTFLLVHLKVSTLLLLAFMFSLVKFNTLSDFQEKKMFTLTSNSPS